MRRTVGGEAATAPRPASRLAVVAIAGALTAAVVTGCSSDDPPSARSSPPTSGAAVSSSAEPAGMSTDPTATAVGDGSPTSPASSDPSVATTIDPLPEEGVPGLDSTDRFCRAWSRFGGSFQVVAVAASFSTGPPRDVYALEVIASPVVADAYADLLAAWPAELETEREVAAEQFLGPYARRSASALEALGDAGADDADRAMIASAWLDTLAARDPDVPDVSVDLPDDLWRTVDAAAVALESSLVPTPQDPSLVTSAAVPLTEQYLAETCPDRGTLGGTEID